MDYDSWLTQGIDDYDDDCRENTRDDFDEDNIDMSDNPADDFIETEFEYHERTTKY